MSSSADTPSFTGSSILGESPPFHSSSNTGLGGVDLSLSELYVSDRSDLSPPSQPFSLLPQRGQNNGDAHLSQEKDVFTEDNDRHEADGGDATIIGAGKSSTSAARTREERLEHDLFVLKKLNSSFAAYNDALNHASTSTQASRTSSQSSTAYFRRQNVAVQLTRTDHLLDQYISLLQHTEENSKLIFDELWEGGGTDQEIWEKLRLEAEQRAKLEQEERERALQLERERQEREEEGRRMKEEREARQKDRPGSATVRGVRGARGIKARGSERGTSIPGLGRVHSKTTIQTARGASTVAARGVRTS